MKKHLPLLPIIFFCFLSSLFFAQQVAEHTIYFDSGKDTPTREEKNKIDAMLKRVTNKKLIYTISICGHTDNTGADQLNRNLSDRRAKNIADYVKKEFKTTRMEVMGKSYTEPASPDTAISANALNRRVYISISIPAAQVCNIGDIKLDKREYIVDADKNDTLIYPSGTKLIIKSGIFVDEIGNKINGKVMIKYVEFRDPVDFILAGAHMYYSDKGENMIFNSSGMFTISGSQEGKSIFIKKGEEIKVNFVPTKAIESGTDFYKYSTSQNQWSDLSKLQTTSTNGAMPVINGHGSMVDKLEICSRDMCEGTKMVVRTGCELTENKIPIYTNIVKKYDLNIPLIRSLDNDVKKCDAQLKVVKKTIDSIRKELNAKPAYTFRKTNSISSPGYAFKIDCDTSLKNNFIDMENVTWLCSNGSKRTVSRLIDSSVYAIRMIKMDSRGNSELKVYSTQYGKRKSLLKVKMELPGENTKNQRKEIYKTYRKRVRLAKAYNKSIEMAQQLVASQMINIKIDRKLAYDNLENELSRVDEDSVECFWANNKPFMKQDEKEMIMIFWYEHFQKNIGKYGQVYNHMRSSNAADDTCAAITKRIEAAVLKAKLEGQTQVAATQIMISLSVGSFGMFNCDQIQRLKNPKTIDAGYADADGKILNINSIYLIDDAINSVLIYNGYMNFSPSSFPYSSSSNNRLIAFDAKGDPWLCSYENFKQAVKSDGKKTFILKKVDAVKSKEELTAMK